jgi:hypothetical protein
MRRFRLRIGGAALALALVVPGLALHATWLAVVAVVVAIVTVALTLA